ncbi:GspH/FimT family pseudopilin [Psychrobacter sp. CAL346-MNA-CIBAN-0220]|uniref:pilus assembly FimT family protein n=1 Tax=Psychrobacter sp. CAL346-MNA-CIBAN-0220 TaxID=3140457 RepID=UPI00332CB081
MKNVSRFCSKSEVIPIFHVDYKILKNSPKYYIERGFTLVELIVTIAVLAIITAIATPTVLTQLANMEAKRIRYGLVSTLVIAKAESYIQHRNLLVCLSNTGGRCDKNSKKNLLLFMDKNDNQDYDASIDELLEKQRLDPEYGTLHLRAGGRHYVRFAGDSGKPRGFFGHIKYCPSSTYSQAMYQISFNQNGIIKYKPNRIHDTGCL